MGLNNGERDAPPRGKPFDSEDCDPKLLAWKDMWIAGSRNEAERTALVGRLFRYALENEDECRYAYSFCREEWIEDNTMWHCMGCKDCMKLGDWHCDRCNCCNWHAILPCECGGVSLTYHIFGQQEST